MSAISVLMMILVADARLLESLPAQEQVEKTSPPEERPAPESEPGSPPVMVKVRAPTHELFQAPEGRARRVTSRNPVSNRDFMFVPGGMELTLANLAGPGMITHLWLALDCADPYFSRKVVLRAFWDGETSPSIEAPICDFFASGHALLANVDSAMVEVSSHGRALNCSWPMPFDRSAVITLRNDCDAPLRALYYSVDWRALEQPFGPDLRTFHACYRQSLRGASDKEFILARMEGEGHLVGCVLSVVSAEEGWPGEGDLQFFVDGETEPSVASTGLEDAFCGAWGMRVEQRPHYGITVFEGSGPFSRSTSYRWMVADPVPFMKSLRVSVERQGWAARAGEWKQVDDRPDQFSGAAFWYQKEPHAPTEPVPFVTERLPFEEDRIELELIADEIETLLGAPRPIVDKDRFLAAGARVVLAFRDVDEACVRIPVRIDVAREYHLVLSCCSSQLGPTVELRVDERALGGLLDLYASEPVIGEHGLGSILLCEGLHWLEIRAVRPAPGGGVEIALDSLMLRW